MIESDTWMMGANVLIAVKQREENRQKGGFSGSDAVNCHILVCYRHTANHHTRLPLIVLHGSIHSNHFQSGKKKLKVELGINLLGLIAFAHSGFL